MLFSVASWALLPILLPCIVLENTALNFQLRIYHFYSIRLQLLSQIHHENYFATCFGSENPSCALSHFRHGSKSYPPVCCAFACPSKRIVVLCARCRRAATKKSNSLEVSQLEFPVMQPNVPHLSRYSPFSSNRQSNHWHPFYWDSKICRRRRKE